MAVATHRSALLFEWSVIRNTNPTCWKTDFTRILWRHTDGSVYVWAVALLPRHLTQEAFPWSLQTAPRLPTAVTRTQRQQAASQDFRQHLKSYVARDSKSFGSNTGTCKVLDNLLNRFTRRTLLRAGKPSTTFSKQDEIA